MAGLLDGKSALITGGGGGIGRATALAFAREGARVAVADVSAELARETVAQVNAAGGQAISLSGDVTRDADVRAMIEGVIGPRKSALCAGGRIRQVVSVTSNTSGQSFSQASQTMHPGAIQTFTISLCVSAISERANLI